MVQNTSDVNRQDVVDATGHYTVSALPLGDYTGLLLGYCGLSTSELRDAMKLFGACMDEIDARMISDNARSTDHRA